MSISRCRELLGDKGMGLTDAEIEQVSEFFCQLADIVLDDLEQGHRSERSGTCGAA